MTKNSKLGRIIAMLSFAVTLTFSTNIYAMNTDTELPAQLETKVYNFIDDIAQSELFCDWAEADIVMEDIYSYTKDNLKVYKLDVMENNIQLGYILSDESGNIISYSRNSEPEDFMQDYCNIYTGADSEEYNTACASAYSDGGLQAYSSPYKVIDGVSPQLQGDSNCVVAAASNVIWYYGNNGHFSLIRNDTFNNVKMSMTNCYIYNGGIGNNEATPKAFEVYIRAKGLSDVYSSDVNLYWDQNATKELMVSEVNEGKPMMLGFRAGSVYSDSAGHMTMCYGYQVTGGNTYAYVASGHEAYGTFVKWDDIINDCIITIRIY